jgi:hypothetical protein
MNNTLIEVEKHKQPPTDSNLPLLVLCINASRLGTDVNQALNYFLYALLSILILKIQVIFPLINV